MFTASKVYFGVVHITFEDLKKSQAEVKDKDTQIAELELELKNLKISKDSEVSGLLSQLNVEQDRANYVEKESGELKSELATFKEHLPQQDEEAIISKFKQSVEYDQALANAGAPEILRCWVVAVRHIKTNTEANCDTFIEDFLAAKDNIEKGLVEPEP